MGYTEEQYAALRNNARRNLSTPPKAKSKYRNVRCEVGGEQFDSKREADYWILLKARERAGEICGLERQVKFPLHCPHLAGPNMEVCCYIADFTFTELGHFHCVDSKGVRTQIFKLKAKWMLLEHGITVEEV